MSLKKWTTCAFLFIICYLIIICLDKTIESFRGGGGGGGRGGMGRGGIGRGGIGRGYYGGRGYGYSRGYYGGQGYGYGRRYYGGVPVVVNDYPSYWYPYFLYPSYWSSYFY
jgi:hypothetical protein